MRLLDNNHGKFLLRSFIRISVLLAFLFALKLSVTGVFAVALALNFLGGFFFPKARPSFAKEFIGKTLSITTVIFPMVIFFQAMGRRSKAMSLTMWE